MRKESSRHSKQRCTHKSGLNLKVPYFFKWASLAAQRVKHLPGNEEYLGSIPGSRRSLGDGNGNALQYSCLENAMDRGA